MENFILEAANTLPSARQLAWQETEFYAFVHFSPNTFTNRAWGLGTEDPALFNPTKLDARQWAHAIKAAGMKGMILTCKHHDGFCLWPSKLTKHSVKNCSWQGGQGDIVREAAQACRQAGLKFGVYLSPWDRHEKTYGDSPAYNRFFIGQLTELLTQYGPIFSVWFDGACGEGANGKRQVYDWDAYYATIRELQPDAVISVCGPDVRWCGNEAGQCRKNEWSVVPAELVDNEKIQEKSQQMDDGKFARRITSSDEDLGGRERIRHAKKLVWYPAEVNTSIRPEWFFHPEENDSVRSVEELLPIYYASVGGNATFLLNIPPDRRGLFHENDVARLKELGDAIQASFPLDLAQDAVMTASESLDDKHGPQMMIDNDKKTYWRPCNDTKQSEITVSFSARRAIDKVVLMEHIASCGQRIESFTLEYEDHGQWKSLYSGTVVGYKKICLFDRIETSKIRVKIDQSRWFPTLMMLGAYCGKKKQND